jgi:Protein of unknown function (DUF2934)
MTGLSKLDELRSKTDRELIQLVNTTLDLGIREAQQALTSADNWKSAEDHYLKAKRACFEAVRVVPLLREVGDEERIGAEAKEESLREIIEAISGVSSAPDPTENQIAALARALWKLKGCPQGPPEENWFQAERALKSYGRAHASHADCYCY